MKRFTLLALVLTIPVLLVTPTAAAEDTMCVGTIGAITVDNVVVPPNATCRLVGTTVLGNVKVLENAIFEARPADIRGDVQADKSFYTDLYVGTKVGGDVQIKNSAVDTDICGTMIDGDLQLEGIQGTLDAARIGETFHPASVTTCVAGSNAVTVGGNLQVSKNKQPVDISGVTVGGNLQYFENVNGEIFNNVITGALQCDKNSPTPTGAGNTAATKEGQCATF